MRRASLGMLVVLAVLFAGCGSSGSSTSTATIGPPPTTPTTPAGALGPPDGPPTTHAQNPACGTEYWDQKTLTDGQAATVDPQPQEATVSQMASQAPPSESAQSAGFHHPDRAGADLHVWRVRALLVAFKQEADSDIHLVIGDGQRTMIAEFPSPDCVQHADAVAREAMTSARAAFLAACGKQAQGAANRSGFTSLSGEAAVVGVGFFDKNHGQNGVADVGNGWGIELHPVLGFSTSGCRQATTQAAGD